MSSKHVRYVFTDFPGCTKKICVIMLMCIMLKSSDHERPDLAPKHPLNFMKVLNCILSVGWIIKPASPHIGRKTEAW